MSRTDSPPLQTAEERREHFFAYVAARKTYQQKVGAHTSEIFAPEHNELWERAPLEQYVVDWHAIDGNYRQPSTLLSGVLDTQQYLITARFALDSYALIKAPSKELADSHHLICELREEAYARNVGLVKKILQPYVDRTIHIREDDLIQEGTIGILRAIDLYHPDRDVVFSTYAWNHIKHSMSHLLIRQERVIRGSRDLEVLAHKASKINNTTLYQERLEQGLVEIVSLSDIIGNDTMREEFIGKTPDHDTPLLEERYVAWIKSVLDPKSAAIFMQAEGIGTARLELVELRAAYNMDTKRIQDIQSKAKRILRSLVRSGKSPITAPNSPKN